MTELQRCYHVDDFVRAVTAEVLMTLVNAIDDNPERPDRSGRKLRQRLQTVTLYLYCRYPGVAAPRSVGELHNRLKNPQDELSPLLVFDGQAASPNTLLKWFRRIDGADPKLVKQALLRISSMLPWAPSPDENTQEKVRDKATRPSARTGRVNDYIKRRETEALGNTEFQALFQQDADPGQFIIDEAEAERLILEWAHNNDIRCPHCTPGKCQKKHHHRVVERKRTLTQRRQWRCTCCRACLSVTAGTVLHSLKLPLKVVLTCLYYMIRARTGISAMQMAGYCNGPGRNMPVARILRLMHRIRAAMVEAPQVFEGTTEIDEAVIALSDGSLVNLIGAYNHETHRVHIEVLARKATKEVMADFIGRVTAPGSRIYVDGDAAVPRTGRDRDTTREYYAVNHSAFEWARHVDLGEDDPRGLWATTNRIEGSWGFLKRSLRLRVSVSKHHLGLYLAEVMWRLNYLGNRIEAETYIENERRELALMKRIVAGMVGKKVTEQRLRGPKVEPAKRQSRQLPLTPRGRAFPKSRADEQMAHDRFYSPSEIPVEWPVQMALPLRQENHAEAAQLPLPFTDPIPAGSDRRRVA